MKLSRILLLLALPTALVVPSAVLGDDYDDFLKKAASDSVSYTHLTLPTKLEV